MNRAYNTLVIRQRRACFFAKVASLVKRLWYVRFIDVSVLIFFVMVSQDGFFFNMLMIIFILFLFQGGGRLWEQMFFPDLGGFFW